MDDLKSTNPVPQNELQGTKKYPLRKVCVKVYLNEPEFLEWIDLAERAGIRPRGLKPFRLKPHGFSHERIANTKGLVKFVKKIILPSWKDGEAGRKAEIAVIKKNASRLGIEVKEV